VKQASTVGSPHDLAVEIAMIQNTASSAVLAVMRSFIAGCSNTEFHMLRSGGRYKKISAVLYADPVVMNNTTAGCTGSDHLGYHQRLYQ